MVDKDYLDLKNEIKANKESTEINKGRIKNLTKLIKIYEKLKNEMRINIAIDGAIRKKYTIRYSDNIHLAKSRIKKLKKQIDIDRQELKVCEEIYSLRTQQIFKKNK